MFAYNHTHLTVNYNVELLDGSSMVLFLKKVLEKCIFNMEFFVKHYLSAEIKEVISLVKSLFCNLLL